MKKNVIEVQVGAVIRIKVKSGSDYSTYRIKIDREAFQGEGLNDIFLEESTGYDSED